MSKKNNRFVIANKCTENKKFRKCAHHIFSYGYAANMRAHDDIVQQAGNQICMIDMDTTIVIKIIFHFMAPVGCYNRDKVTTRAYDIIMSLNDDFNNYTSNPNTMNNFRYKSIINQVFITNMAKQNRYLSNQYMQLLPTGPSNIVFELGEIYFYPVKCRLNLAPYDDIRDIEMEYQAIKQFIHQNHAEAISPAHVLNIWVIDMTETTNLGFSNFPWEPCDNFHGIVINRRAFFPEDYAETNFASFKTITHEVGHFFGLLHVFGHGNGLGAYAALNIHVDDELLSDSPDITQLPMNFDPCDRMLNKKLHLDMDYNPLFMNFMDHTHDKYVTMFTKNQLQKMRYMICKYRPNLNSAVNRIALPPPRPETDMIFCNCARPPFTRTNTVIPSTECGTNPRLFADSPIIREEIVKQPVTPPCIPPPCVPEVVTVPNLVVNTKEIPALFNPRVPNPISYPADPNAYQHYLQYYQMLDNEKKANENNLPPPCDPRFISPCDPRFNPCSLIDFNTRLLPDAQIPQTDPCGPPTSICPDTTANPTIYAIEPRTLDVRIAAHHPRLMRANPAVMAERTKLALLQETPPCVPAVMPAYLEPPIVTQISPAIVPLTDPHPLASSRVRPFVDVAQEIGVPGPNPVGALPPVPVGPIAGTVEDEPYEEIIITKNTRRGCKNPRRERFYSRYATARPETRINSLDPAYVPVPTNLCDATRERRLQPELVPNIVPSAPNACLADRIERLGDQLRNIKTKIETGLDAPDCNSTTEMIIATNKPQFNKYGQRCDITQPKPTRIITTKTPKKRFVRCKPTQTT